MKSQKIEQAVDKKVSRLINFARFREEKWQREREDSENLIERLLNNQVSKTMRGVVIC